MSTVEHVEKDVVRDGNGRILRVEEHKWPEPASSYTEHAVGLRAVRDENAALRAKVAQLTNTITALAAHYGKQIEQIAAAWLDSDGERNAVVLTRLQEIPSVLAERDALTIAQRDEQWNELLREEREAGRR